MLTIDAYARAVLADKPNKTQEDPTHRKYLRVLHLTDLHPDLFYEAGTAAVCGEPVCCRTDVKAANGSFPAGYWGSNAECDIPLRTISLLLDALREEPLDLVLWTGDNTAHDIWKQSQSYNLNFTTVLTELIRKKLPRVQVVPSLGNHESYPVNVYEWGRGNSLELTAGVAEAWGDWIGAQAKQVLRDYGYFSLYLQQLNLRVVSLNTQAGNDENWVLLKDPTDPGNHLAWLQKELLDAESKGQLVYIIGHIPPSDNLEDWGARYNILVDRFSYIIRGQFFGHTHNDHMSFFTAVGDSTRRIINNYMVAPSVTTSTERNPRYRILKVDADTMRVVDYDQFKYVSAKPGWSCVKTTPRTTCPSSSPTTPCLRSTGCPGSPSPTRRGSATGSRPTQPPRSSTPSTSTAASSRGTAASRWAARPAPPGASRPSATAAPTRPRLSRRWRGRGGAWPSDGDFDRS